MKRRPFAELYHGVLDPSAIRQMARCCLRCSVCHHITVHDLKGGSPSSICPSGDLFKYLAYYPSGRIEIVRAIIEGELCVETEDDLRRLCHVAHTCLMCGACEILCERGSHPLLLSQFLRDWVAEHGISSAVPRLVERVRETGHIYGCLPQGREEPSCSSGKPLPSPHRHGDNLRAALAEVSAVVGKEWVRDDLPTCTAYGRDASLAERSLPHFVVLPASTEEVAGVLVAANRLNIPVTVRSTALNLEGLAVPKRGGIVLDMVRMDRILEVDREGMSVTVEPCATVGQVQAAAEASGLRAAQPGAPGSVSLMGNTLLLGLSITSVCYGTGADRIRASTVVLPSGEIIKLGSKTWGGPPPGYDLSRVLRCGNGRFGICTEMTVDLFPLDGLWRMGAAIYTGEGETPPLSPLRKMARTSLPVYLSLFNGVTIAHQLATSDAQAEELKESLPAFILTYGVQGYTEADLEARDQALQECLKGTEWASLPGEMVGSMFQEFIGGSAALTRMGGEVCRWGRGGETIRWTKTWTKVDQVPSVCPFLREGVLQHMTGERVETGLYIQMYEFGRNAYVEIDYFPVLSRTHERQQALLASREFARRSAARGLTGGIVAHAKKGSPYAGLEAALKAILDPQGILNPHGEEGSYQPDVCG